MPTNLREAIAAHFSKDDLRVLCHDIGINAEDLPRNESGVSVWALELVEYARRVGKTPALLDQCAKLRPQVGIEWHTLPNPPSQDYLQAPTTQPPQNVHITIHTGGGAYIEGDLHVKGDFNNRGNITHSPQIDIKLLRVLSTQHDAWQRADTELREIERDPLKLLIDVERWQDVWNIVLPLCKVESEGGYQQAKQAGQKLDALLKRGQTLSESKQNDIMRLFKTFRSAVRNCFYQVGVELNKHTK